MNTGFVGEKRVMMKQRSGMKRLPTRERCKLMKRTGGGWKVKAREDAAKQRRLP